MLKITLDRVSIYPRLYNGTIAFNAKLLFDGVVVGEVSNDGGGGCHRYHYSARQFREAFEAYLAEDPTRDGETEVTRLVAIAREVQILKRSCKKSVAFTCKDAPGKQYQLKFDPGGEQAAIDRIRRSEGSNLGLIANEDIAKFAEVTVTESFAAMDAELRAKGL